MCVCVHGNWRRLHRAASPSAPPAPPLQAPAPTTFRPARTAAFTVVTIRENTAIAFGLSELHTAGRETRQHADQRSDQTRDDQATNSVEARAKGEAEGHVASSSRSHPGNALPQRRQETSKTAVAAAAALSRTTVQGPPARGHRSQSLTTSTVARRKS